MIALNGRTPAEGEPMHRYTVTYLAGSEERSVSVSSRERVKYGPDGWVSVGGVEFNGRHILRVEYAGLTE